MRHIGLLSAIVWGGFGLSGCLAPPEFPLLEEIPIEAGDLTCAPARDAVAACGVDGDTFDLDACITGERVRLVGVSAAELSTKECFSQEAGAELARLITGRKLRLSFDVDCTDNTPSNRTLAYAWLLDDNVVEDLLQDADPQVVIDTQHPFGGDEPGILVNEWLIAAGFARVYPEEYFGTPIYHQRLSLAEAEAQRRGWGLWSSCEDPDEVLPPPR